MTGAPPLRTTRAGVPAAVPHGRQPLALAVLMVVRFLTFLDNKRVMLSGAAVFCAGSVLCAMAPMRRS
jgi:hypothetical protein